MNQDKKYDTSYRGQVEAMNRDCTKATTPSVLTIGMILILAGIIADIVDLIYFQVFLQRNDIGLLQGVPWALTVLGGLNARMSTSTWSFFNLTRIGPACGSLRPANPPMPIAMPAVVAKISHRDRVWPGILYFFHG